MYKHLFVPIDGSELSHRAMDGSIELALQLGARITGFVVEPDLPLSAAKGAASTFVERVKTHVDKNEAHATALLGQFQERATSAGVAFTGAHVTTGSVNQAITDEATRLGCDMIVMVTHGRGPMGEFLFGSHTKRVIATSPLPVLVLH